jgi:membrane protein DedA with SNARE-associated domain
MVYLYLMFGSIVMISFIGQAAGILLGYWFGERFGQG